MTDGVQFVLPTFLENIILNAKIILFEENEIGNPFVPKVSDYRIEQRVAKFWIELVKEQERMKLTSAYYLPVNILAQRFVDYLMDQKMTYLTENYLSRLNVPGNVVATIDVHQPHINLNTTELVVRHVQSTCTAKSSHKSSDKIFEKNSSGVFHKLSKHPQPDLEIVVIEEHKTVHKSVQGLAKAKQKTGSKKKWSLRRLLTTLCPCIRPNKVKRSAC